MTDDKPHLDEPKYLKQRSVGEDSETGVEKSGYTLSADPRFYYYHPRSTLALGRNFDHRDITESKPSAIVAQPIWLDQGAPSSSVDAFFVRDQRSLNLTAKRDIHVEGRYLTSNASVDYNFDGISKFSSDSISVVFIATVDFGREGLQAGATLTPQAASELQANPVAFARRYGRRYVAQQRRGAHLTAVVTVDALDSYTKNTFTTTLQGGTGIGEFSAKAKATFNKIVESAAKQSRMRIEVRAVGGNGPADLVKILTGYAKDADDPFSDISAKLKGALAGFTKENSAVIEYTISSMSDFGLSDNTLPPWLDAQEEQLIRLSEDYRNTLKDIEIIESYEAGTGPYPRRFPQFMDFALYNANDVSEVRPIVEGYRDAVKAQHAACLTGTGVSACGFPPGRYADRRHEQKFLGEELQERDTPPKVSFEVMAVKPGSDQHVKLDPVQAAIVLRSDPTARLAAVKFFEPDATEYYCWFVYGGRIASYRWITEWEDGTVHNQQGSGFGEMFLLFSQDGGGRNRGEGEEQRIINWMGRSTGSHAVRRKLVFYDIANREFEVTFFEGRWTAGGGGIQSGKCRFLGTNGNVERRF